MPFLGLAALLASLACAAHAVQTRRPRYWLMILLALPGAGALAYLIFEILPEIGRTGSRRAADAVIRTFDPERVVREAEARVLETPSAQTRAELGAVYLETGRAVDAIAAYRAALSGTHATDPALMLGLARAHFAAGDMPGTEEVLLRLRQANPDWQSAEGHLLYARALEAQGKIDAAVAEYRALLPYYPGQEPRARLALLLKAAGAPAEARRLFTELRLHVERAPRHVRDAERAWYDLARRELVDR